MFCLQLRIGRDRWPHSSCVRPLVQCLATTRRGLGSLVSNAVCLNHCGLGLGLYPVPLCHTDAAILALHQSLWSENN
jgi:hypothetical protein